jgi:hypothetical protein
MKKISRKLVIILTVILALLFTQVPVSATTVVASGGVARLDYMVSAPGYFTWSVKPNTVFAYEFTGEIVWSGGASGARALFGIGALGSTVSGTFASGTYNTGYGTATLSGTAYNQLGHGFVVAPGVTIWYSTKHGGGGGTF